ncbi:MAG: alkaline phosphatase family protein, partial [Candidatus Nanohaloarchaea archaeon]
MKPLLVLGLDGLDPYFVEAHSDELENLSDHSVLESTLPPITVPAWASSFTGRKPEKLDRFDFQVVDFDSYEFRPEPHSAFFDREFWSYMDGKAAIADVPGADVREIDGWNVAGLFDVSEDSSKPPELMKEMEDDLGDIEIGPLSDYPTEKKRREAAFEFFGKRKKMLYWLMDNRDAEVYFTVFRLPDTMMHHCSNDEQLLDAYRKCDEMVGELKDRGINMIVLSDHGAVEATRRFSVNTWLRENGFLETKSRKTTPRERLSAAFKSLALEAAEFAERFGFRDYLVWANE